MPLPYMQETILLLQTILLPPQRVELLAGVQNALVTNNNITYIEEGADAFQVTVSPQGQESRNITISHNTIKVQEGASMKYVIRLFAPGYNIRFTDNIIDPHANIPFIARIEPRMANGKEYFGDSIYINNNTSTKTRRVAFPTKKAKAFFLDTSGNHISQF